MKSRFLLHHLIKGVKLLCSVPWMLPIHCYPDTSRFESYASALFSHVSLKVQTEVYLEFQRGESMAQWINKTETYAPWL